MFYPDACSGCCVLFTEVFVRVVFTGHVFRLLLFYMNAKLGGLAAEERVKMEVGVRVRKINAAVCGAFVCVCGACVCVHASHQWNCFKWICLRCSDDDGNVCATLDKVYMLACVLVCMRACVCVSIILRLAATVCSSQGDP